MSNKQNDIFREGKQEKDSERVWSDAIYASYVSKIRSILIPLTDELGWDDSKKHRDAFDKAFGELVNLFRNI